MPVYVSHTHTGETLANMQLVLAIVLSSDHILLQLTLYSSIVLFLVSFSSIFSPFETLPPSAISLSRLRLLSLQESVIENPAHSLSFFASSSISALLQLKFLPQSSGVCFISWQQFCVSPSAKQYICWINWEWEWFRMKVSGELTRCERAQSHPSFLGYSSSFCCCFFSFSGATMLTHSAFYVWLLWASESENCLLPALFWLYNFFLISKFFLSRRALDCSSWSVCSNPNSHGP